MMRFFLVIAFIITLMANSVQATETKATPIPLPKKIRVESAALRGKVWERLSEKQKTLAHHLVQAGREGRNLLFLQVHRHGLIIKEMLEKSSNRRIYVQTE